MTEQVTKTVAELAAQKAELEKQIVAARKAEVKGVIAQIHSLMADYELTFEDLTKKPAKATKAKSEGAVAKVAPKYKNPNGEETWTGRGKTPLWVAEAEAEGYTREEMLIA